MELLLRRSLILLGLMMTWYSKKWFPIGRCICVFMPNLHKNFWIVYNIFIFLCNITISRWNIIFSDKCICKKWKHVEITIKLRWGMGKRRYKNWLQKFSWTIKFSSNSTMMGCRLESAQWYLSSFEFKFDDYQTFLII